jgi:hypothetical protein
MSPVVFDRHLEGMSINSYQFIVDHAGRPPPGVFHLATFGVRVARGVSRTLAVLHARLHGVLPAPRTMQPRNADVRVTPLAGVSTVRRTPHVHPQPGGHTPQRDPASGSPPGTASSAVTPLPFAYPLAKISMGSLVAIPSDAVAAGRDRFGRSRVWLSYRLTH